MSKTIVLLTMMLMTIPAWATKPCNDELSADEVSARTVHAALLALDDPAPPARIRAMETLLKQGRRALRAGEGSRNLVRRLRTINPNLFARLFDADEGMRWAAAYVICAFRDMTMPEHLLGVLALRPPAIEAKMLRELESYLVDRQTQFMQYLDTEDPTADGDNWNIMVHVRVESELPFQLAGRKPRIPQPAWLTQSPRLTLTVHERNGVVHREITIDGENDGALRLSGTFDLKIPKTTKLEHLLLFFDFRVDGHRLDDMRIEGGDLVAKDRRHAPDFR